MKKILVYSHDGFGLGNIRRMLEITTHLVDRDPEITVLLVSGSAKLHAFRIPARVDYVKLPCIGRSEKGDTVVRSLNIGSEDTVRLRADIIRTAAVRFNPDLILVDKKPFGLYGELKAALTALRRGKKRPKMVLLLRDILDAPDATIRDWEKNGYHDAIQALYDQVLIVGTRELFDAVREYRFPKLTAEKVRYCGYIERPAPTKPREKVRAELGFGDEPMVLVTAGGGADGYAMMKAYLSGLAGRTRECSFRTLVISGPEMPASERDEIVSLAARCARVTVKEFTDDMVSCMNAADLVVSMGGYNTVCELLTLKKEAIIVPRVRPVQEQWIRAERMQEMGLLRAIHPDMLTPECLIEAVEHELAADGAQRHGLDSFVMDALPRIAQAIADVMSETPVVTPRRWKLDFSLPAMGIARENLPATAAV
jgi:predicted glycosyltransferase